jgi:hypothetical protein
MPKYEVFADVTFPVYLGEYEAETETDAKEVPDAEWGVIQNALASAIDTLHTALAAYRAARDAAQQKGSE